MKRLILLMVVLIVAVFAVYKLTKKDPYSTLGKDNDFAVTDTARIGRIFLSERDGKTANLTRNGIWWYVNNKYKINPAVMESLMKTIFGLETQFRPPKEAVKTMVRNLATSSTKVEIYNTSGKLIRVFYVGGVTPDEGGTYMIMEGEEQPFVVGVKGKDGGVKVSFFTDEEKWRDKGIFRYAVDDIKSVSIEYPKLKNQSFKLEKNGENYTVEPYYAGVPKSKLVLNHSKIENYLTGFKMQIAENFSNNYSGKDSVLQLLPFAIMKVEDIKGAKHEVKLFPIIPTNKEGKMILDNGKPVPHEKYFAWVDNQDLLVVQELVFGKLLWAYPYFFDEKK